MVGWPGTEKLRLIRRYIHTQTAITLMYTKMAEILFPISLRMSQVLADLRSLAVYKERFQIESI